jgi:hypothetical protein
LLDLVLLLSTAANAVSKLNIAASICVCVCVLYSLCYSFVLTCLRFCFQFLLFFATWCSIRFFFHFNCVSSTAGRASSCARVSEWVMKLSRHVELLPLLNL